MDGATGRACERETMSVDLREDTQLDGVEVAEEAQ